MWKHGMLTYLVEDLQLDQKSKVCLKADTPKRLSTARWIVGRSEGSIHRIDFPKSTLLNLCLSRCESRPTKTSEVTWTKKWRYEMFTKPKIPKTLWLSVVIFVLLSFPALAQMSSTNYKIPVSVMDATGTEKNSDNYKIKDAMGQPTPVGDPKTSQNYKLLSGFIYTDGQIYIPGDASSDCGVNIGDVVYLVTYLFANGPCPKPMKAGDVNCDYEVNIGDVVYLATYLFGGGPPPKPGCVDPDP